MGDTISATINGVVEDLLHSSIPEADVIVRWEQVRYLNWSLAPDQLGNAGSTSAFVLVREGSDFPSRAEDMAHWFKEYCRLVSSILRKPLLTLLCEREIGVS